MIGATADIEVNLSALIQYEKDVNSQLNQSSTGPVEKALKQWGVRYRSFVQLRFDKYSKGGGDWKPLAQATIDARRKGKDTKKRIKKAKEKLDKLKANNKTGKAKTPSSKKNPAAKSRKKKVTFSGAIKSAKKKFKTYRTERKKNIKRRQQIKSLNTLITKLSTVMKAAILRDTGTLFMALTPTFSGRPGAIEDRIPFGIRVGYGGPDSHANSNSNITIAEIAEVHNLGTDRVPRREIIVEPSPNVLTLMSEDMERGLNRLANQGPD